MYTQKEISYPIKKALDKYSDNLILSTICKSGNLELRPKLGRWGMLEQDLIYDIVNAFSQITHERTGFGLIVLVVMDAEELEMNDIKPTLEYVRNG